MASIWECSIDYSDVLFATSSVGNPDPRAYDWDIRLRTICLPLLDPIPKYNPPVDVGHFSVGLGLTATGASAMGIQFQLGDSEINEFYWQSSFDFPEVFNT